MHEPQLRLSHRDRPRRRALLGPLLFVIGTATSVWALEPRSALSQYAHDVYTTVNGLPQDSIRAVTQTTDGYLWVATMGGLARFDGVGFTVFNSANVRAMSNDRITALAPGPDGTLWIGTGGYGVLRLKDGTFTSVAPASELPEGNVRALYVDSNGTLWIGTDWGLSKYDHGHVTTVFQGGRALGVHCAMEYPAGTLWAGTNSGLKKLKMGEITTYTVADGLPANSIWGLAKGRDDELWIGTRPGGLSVLQNGRFRNYTTRDGLTHSAVIALQGDRQGNIWIGTDGGGLNRLWAGQFSSYQTREGLSNQVVRCLFEDQEGSLWVGTAGGGLDRLKDYRFTVRSSREDLPSDMVRSVFQDVSGDVWVGTGNGVARIPVRGRAVQYSTQDGFLSDLTWPILRDREGNLWAGSEEGTLQRFRKGVRPAFRDAWELASPTRIIFEQRDGTIWVGTASDVWRIRGGQKTSVGKRDGLVENSITAIIERADGTLWVGTRLGVQEYRGGRFQAVIDISKGLAGNTVTDLHEDRDRNLWILTSGGISRMAGGRIQSYTKASGLPDANLFQVLEDDYQNLWITSRTGLLRIARAEFDTLDRGRAKTLKVDVFGPGDRIRGSSEFNFGYFPSACKMRNGTLWFPTFGGILTVDPSRMTPNLRIPPVFIERVATDQKSVLEDGGRVGGARNVEFHYTALSYLFPERVRFRYRLEGFDPGWTEAGTRRVAYYTNLPPGDYRFHVVACNNDGVWNEAGASFALRVIPTFYQTPWFYGLCGLMLALAGSGVYHWKVRGLRRREKELQERVDQRTAALRAEVEVRKLAEEAAALASRSKSAFLANMSHEIRTPMNAIIGMAELAHDLAVGSEQRDYLDTVRRSSESLLALLNDILDLSKVEAGKLELMAVDFSLRRCVGDTVRTLHARADEKRLSITCQIAQDIPEFLNGDELRLRQVLINLLGNAIKFTEQGKILVEVGVLENAGTSVTLAFRIADTGIGIPPDKQHIVFSAFQQADTSTTRVYGGTGLGLSIVTQLVRMMKGEIRVESPWRNAGTGEVVAGSAFHFTALLARGNPPKAATRERMLLPLPPLRILLADDNLVNRKLASILLEKLGHTVVLATDGQEAVDAFEHAEVDVVVMDIQMPRMDGYQATAAIREKEKTRGGHVPIIALTAHSLQGHREQCLAAGMDAHLAKPIRSDDLARVLSDVVKTPLAGQAPETSPRS